MLADIIEYIVCAYRQNISRKSRQRKNTINNLDTTMQPTDLENDEQTALDERVADSRHALPIQHEHVIMLRHLHNTMINT